LGVGDALLEWLDALHRKSLNEADD